MGKYERKKKKKNSGEIRLTGLAGRIAEVVRQANDRELHVLPEAAALTAMSALAAPRCVVRGPQGRTALSVYAIALGGTGSGKEALRSAVEMALTAAGRPDELLYSIASDKALHRAFTQRGTDDAPFRGSYAARVLAIDESGLQMNATRRGNNGHQQLLLAKMMELFGLGLKRLPAHKYADDRNEIPAVRHPRLTTILTSTPQTYERAISQEDSESGMLNRFLAFREKEDVPPLRQGRVDRDLMLDPPQDIVRAARLFLPRTYESVVDARLRDQDTDIIVEMDADADAVFDKFRRGEVEDWRRKGGLEGESWARAAEYALRICGLLALSDAAVEEEREDLTGVICTGPHMELAIKIVRRSIQGVMRLARNAGKSEVEQLKDKVLASISKLAGTDGFARLRDVHRDCFRSVPIRVRDDVIRALIEDGEIILDEVATGGRPGGRYAIAQDRLD